MKVIMNKNLDTGTYSAIWIVTRTSGRSEPTRDGGARGQDSMWEGKLWWIKQAMAPRAAGTPIGRCQPYPWDSPGRTNVL